MSPDELLAKHTSRQLTEWAAYFKVEEADMKQAQSKAKNQQAVAGAGRRRG